MRVTGEINRGMIHIAPGENYSWLYDFQRSLGRTITWSSILTYPPEWKSRAPYRGKLERHTEGRRTGADVWVQVTCRPIVQQILMNEPTPFYQLPAFADLVATPVAERHRLYRDPAWRARVFDEFESSKWVNPGWPTFMIAESATHPELMGRSVLSIAQERGCTPFDVVADVALDDDLLTRFEVTFANNDAEGISLLVQGEGCIMGLSDAGAHISQICDAVMPTDFLSLWVRDRGVMPIEQGIRKLSGEIADVIGVDRGYIRTGSPADIVVLDLEQLSTGPLRRVRDMPADGERLVADSPTGIDAVLVNGTPIRVDGKAIDHLLDELPGAVLRSVPPGATR
jgi:N-acyl-D-aspartate/D-glutamate deacylase